MKKHSSSLEPSGAFPVHARNNQIDVSAIANIDEPSGYLSTSSIEIDTSSKIVLNVAVKNSSID